MDLCGRQQRTFLEKIGPMLTGGGGWGGRGSRRAPGGLSEGSECSVQEWVISVWNCYCFTHNTCGPFGGGCREHFLKKGRCLRGVGVGFGGWGYIHFTPPSPAASGCIVNGLWLIQLGFKFITPRVFVRAARTLLQMKAHFLLYITIYV